jgi:hypothetical protein
VFAAEQRIEVALRHLGAGCDLERGGTGEAALAEDGKRRREHAFAGRTVGSFGTWPDRGSHGFFTCHLRKPLALVPKGTVYIHNWYYTVPSSMRQAAAPA